MMQRCRKLDLGFHRRNITGVRLAQVRWPSPAAHALRPIQPFSVRPGGPVGVHRNQPSDGSAPQSRSARDSLRNTGSVDRDVQCSVTFRTRKNAGIGCTGPTSSPDRAADRCHDLRPMLIDHPCVEVVSMTRRSASSQARCPILKSNVQRMSNWTRAWDKLGGEIVETSGKRCPLDWRRGVGNDIWTSRASGITGTLRIAPGPLDGIRSEAIPPAGRDSLVLRR